MNLLFIDRNTKVSGLNTYICSLAPSLRRLGHHCFLIARGGPRLSVTRSLFDGFFWHPPLQPFAGMAVARAIRRWDIDLIVTQTTACARHAFSTAQAAGVPVVMHIHNRTDLTNAGPAADYATRIVVMNENTAEHIRKGFPTLGPKLFVSVLPVNEEAFPATPPRSEPGFAVAYCARLSRTKGEHALAAIEATEPLMRQVPDLSLVIIGGRGGSRFRTARSRAADLNSRAGRQAVTLVGQTLDPRRYMEQADLVIGAGYVALEALSLNRRVLGVGFAGMFGEITPANLLDAVAANCGDTGAQTPDVTAAALAEGINAAYRHHLQEGQITWGHERVAALCAPDAVAAQLGDLYLSAVEGRSHAR